MNALSDADIAQAVAGDPDSARLDVDWSAAKLFFPRTKQATSLRIDPDVLDFFKASGRGYQTRMNAVLRAYMMHERGPKRSR